MILRLVAVFSLFSFLACAQDDAYVLESGVYVIKETKPSSEPVAFHPYGSEMLGNYYFSRLNYPPDIAKSVDSSYNVNVCFKVETDGSLTGFHFKNPVKESLINEVLRLLLNDINWLPAQVGGKKIVTEECLTFHFYSRYRKLSKDETTVAAVYSISDGDQIAEKKPLNEVYDMPETEAEFIGGENALNDFLVKNLKNPFKDEYGTVYVTGIVELNGDISSYEIVRGLSKYHDKEVIRVCKMLPKCTPAKEGGKAVRSRKVFAIKFTETTLLNESAIAARKYRKFVSVEFSEPTSYVRNKHAKYVNEWSGLDDYFNKVCDFSIDILSGTEKHYITTCFQINETGHVTKIAFNSTGHPNLTRPMRVALENMPPWIPRTKEGKPKKSTECLTFSFQLDSIIVLTDSKKEIENPYRIQIKPNTGQILQEVIIDWVDEESSFPGGTVEMIKFIQKNLEYPDTQLDIVGKVYLDFIIEKDGTISNIIVRKGLAPEFDRKAIEVVHKMPNWIPAKFKGQVVRSRLRLPVAFTLD